MTTLLKRLRGLWASKPRADGGRFRPIYAFNLRCREPIAGQIDLLNELSRSEEGEHAFFCRKVIHTSGRNHCYSEVEIQIWFDDKKNIVRQETKGGRWLDQAEYEVELARFQASQAQSDASQSSSGEFPGSDQSRTDT